MDGRDLILSLKLTLSVISLFPLECMLFHSSLPRRILRLSSHSEAMFVLAHSFRGASVTWFQCFKAVNRSTWGNKQQKRKGLECD